MEGNKNSVVIDGSFLIFNACIESIQEKLNRSIFSEDELKLMSKQLETFNQNALEPYSKETYHTLCGKIVTLSLNTWIDNIVEKSFSIRTEKYSSSTDLGNKVNALRVEIARLWRDNALSLENRRFIKVATKNLDKIFPLSKINDEIQASSSMSENTTATLANTTVFHKKESESQDNTELAFYLCEMAHLFYQHRFEEGLIKLYQLTQPQKNQLENHCFAMNTDMITKNTDSKNQIHFIQAIIGYATELTQGDDFGYYPSSSELKMMFEEAASYS